MPNDHEVKVKSLKKAIEVLNCFIEKQPLGVTEISEKLGLYKSNVHNILSTYVAMDYLTKDELSDKYYLGEKIIFLSRAIGDRYNLRNIARSQMDAIAREAKEKVYLTVPIDRNTYYLDVVFPPGSNPHFSNILNSTEPMHCTSAGKAILAFSTQEFIEDYLSQPLVSLTQNTMTEPNELRAELNKIRKNGYSTDNMEAELGISCVGAPILSSANIVVGAISISGISSHFTEERIGQLAAILKKNIREMEKYL